MKLLAVDTATNTCSVALAENDRTLVELTADFDRTHARHLLVMIDELLRQADTDITDLDRFAVTIGPGSFTGLRIGISTVNGLARSLGKPVAGISTLEALAFPFSGVSDPICPFIDARKKEVYTALYRWTENRFETILPPRVLPPGEALRQIGGRCILVGNGAVLYRDLIEERLGTAAVSVPVPMHMIRASMVAHLGFRRLAGADCALPEVQPFYIRRSDAERYAKVTGQAC